MKTKTLGLLLCVMAGLFIVSCGAQTPKVKPLAIDLPASYKSDSAAYNFIIKQIGVWNTFGKKVDKLSRKAEKWREKEFYTLSERELISMLNLERDYLALWITQEAYIQQMMLEATNALRSASEQGKGKIIETQRLVSEYYLQLTHTYGSELNLDKEPYIYSPEEDSLYNAKRDSIRMADLDSLEKQMDGRFPQTLIDSILLIPTPPGPK